MIRLNKNTFTNWWNMLVLLVPWLWIMLNEDGDDDNHLCFPLRIIVDHDRCLTHTHTHVQCDGQTDTIKHTNHRICSPRSKENIQAKSCLFSLSQSNGYTPQTLTSGGKKKRERKKNRDREINKWFNEPQAHHDHSISNLVQVKFTFIIIIIKRVPQERKREREREGEGKK